MGAAAAGIGAKLAAAFTVGALVQWFRATTDGLDRLNDLKDATGASIENLSALDDIGRRTGTSFDTMSSIVVKFNSALKDADASKGAGAVLKSMNLDIEALKRLDPAEALRQVAVSLGQYADDGDKARAVQELFGKSVRDAAPFLKDLAEAGRLNATVTTQQAEEAEKFNKELYKLQAATGNVARSLTGDLVTALNAVIEKFRLGQKEGKSFFATAAGIYTQNVKDFYGITDPAKGRSASGPIIDQTDPRAGLRAIERAQDARPSLQMPAAAAAGSGGGRSRSGGATGKTDAERERDRREAEYQQGQRDYINAQFGAWKNKVRRAAAPQPPC